MRAIFISLLCFINFSLLASEQDVKSISIKSPSYFYKGLAQQKPVKSSLDTDQWTSTFICSIRDQKTSPLFFLPINNGHDFLFIDFGLAKADQSFDGDSSKDVDNLSFYSKHAFW